MPRRTGWGIAFIVLALLPFMANNYIQYVCNLILINIVAVIGLNIIIGYAGQFAFAHSAFMGIGAYTTGLLMTRWGVPFLVALPVSGVLTALIGCALGLPTLRVRGIYLALTTVAFTELVQWVFVHWDSVTLGVQGMHVPPPAFLGAVQRDKGIYYVLLPVVFLMVWLAKQILESKLGRAFAAIRDSEVAAQSVGISLATTKAAAFGLSAFYGGIAGSLFAVALGYVLPESFALVQVFVLFSMVAIGGMGSLAGSIIGAVILTALPEGLRSFLDVQEIIYGALLTGFIFFMPSGIAGTLRRHGWLQREILARGWWEERDAPGARPPKAR